MSGVIVSPGCNECYVFNQVFHSGYAQFKQSDYMLLLIYLMSDLIPLLLAGLLILRKIIK
jgi:hypothetical protein